MKRINFLCIVFFGISVIAFGVYCLIDSQNRDRVGPVITMDADQITAGIDATESDLLKGVSASDLKDGDVTDSIVIESISEFVSSKTRFVNYAAFDKDNHVSKASRKLVYSDYTHPRFSLTSPLRFSMGTTSQNILDCIHVEDCLDGDISDKVNFTSERTIMMSVPSDYPVNITVTNSAGDTVTLPVTLTVYDTSKESQAPKIGLKDYLVYTQSGKKIDAASYIENVTYKGETYKPVAKKGTFGADLSDMTDTEIENMRAGEQTVSYDDIRINDNVDYNKPGAYEIQYTADGDNGSRGQVFLIVVVEEA